MIGMLLFVCFNQPRDIEDDWFVLGSRSSWDALWEASVVDKYPKISVCVCVCVCVCVRVRGPVTTSLVQLL